MFPILSMFDEQSDDHLFSYERPQEEAPCSPDHETDPPSPTTKQVELLTQKVEQEVRDTMKGVIEEHKLTITCDCLKIEYRACSGSISLDAYRDGDYELEIDYDDPTIRCDRENTIATLTKIYDEWVRENIEPSDNVDCDGDGDGLHARSKTVLEGCEELLFILLPPSGSATPTK